MAKGIQALLDTILEALPQVGNLSLLFLLLFFIFAALGVELFGRIQCTEEQACVGLDKHANFQNFGMALLILFRVATGDNWNAILKVRGRFVLLIANVKFDLKRIHYGRISHRMEIELP